MNEFWTKLFDSRDFDNIWKHGNWSSGHLWTHGIADLTIFVACAALAIIIAIFTARREDLPFRRVFWMLCGLFALISAVHLMHAVLLVIPVYRFVAVLKVSLALTAAATVVLLIPAVVKALALTSPQQLKADIAKRTQELQDSETRLRAIVETAQDGILTLDENLTILTANPVCETLFGVPVDEMIGQPWVDFVTSESHSVLQDQVGTGEGKVLGAGGDIEGKRADGSVFPATLSMSKVRIGNGRNFNAIVHDISVVKQTEEALRQSEARLRLMLAQVPAVLCSTDSKLRVTLFACSPTTGLSSSGYHVKRFSGMSLLDSNDETLRFLPGQAFKKALRGDGVSVGVQWQQRFFQFHVQALRNPHGKVIGTIGIGLDVTEQKRVEDALVRSNQELDEFAHVASHDLKEPLRGIHHYCSFLIEDYTGRLDEEGAARLQRLQELANHLGALIESLLEFSRVGRVSLAVRDTNLNKLVEEVLYSLRISLQESKVDVRLPQPLPTIRCDAVRLAEVFRNLITNAMKYNDKAEKWIEIGTAPLSALANLAPGADKDNPGTRRRHVFYVKDNGIGIQAKHRETVFRIFKRLHGRDKFGGGTGAGLTIVKKIIERHGGQIYLESTPRQGTTFFFTLDESPPEAEVEK